MKQEIIVTIAGENAGSYVPLCFSENFDVDFSEKVLVCRNWDDDGLISVERFRKSEIEIPEWMDEEFYLQNYIHFKFAIGLAGEKFVLSLNKVQLKNLLGLSVGYKYFIGKYLKGNTKSSFKLSIKEQIWNWLSNENNKYEVPLSPKQFEIASNYIPLYEAEKISNGITRYFSW